MRDSRTEPDYNSFPSHTGCDGSGSHERRRKMLDRVRKLLAMGNDGRGNAHEMENALRQASRIMAEYGISEADADLSALDAGTMTFGETFVKPDGMKAGTGRTFTEMPTWVSVLSLGVAYFTDSISTINRTAHGIGIKFQGEKNDVTLASWLMGVLVDEVQRAQTASGWTSRADANLFRRAAASRLQERMKEAARDRHNTIKTAAAKGSRALVVVDRKKNEIAVRFGKQRVSNKSGRSRGDCGAREAGQEAGNRININRGRPIGQSSPTGRLK